MASSTIILGLAELDPVIFLASCLSSLNSTHPEPLEALEKLKDFFVKTTSLVNQQIKDKANDALVKDVASKGAPLLVVDDVAIMEPMRGRCKLSISKSTILIEGKSGSLVISADNLSHLVVVPSHISSTKDGEDLLALRLKIVTKLNGKDIRHVLLSLGKVPTKLISTVDGDTGTQSHLITKLLESVCAIAGVRPIRSLFLSLVKQKYYLNCYKGTQEGAIFPLQCGIVFLKPLVFIPAEEISSITAGRGGGSGNTRYIDLKIETVDDRTHEFTNIERDELPALQGYVKGYLEARATKQLSSSANDFHRLSSQAMQPFHREGQGEGASEDSDDSDEDFDPDHDSEQDSRDSDDSGSDGSVAGSGDEDESMVGKEKKNKREVGGKKERGAKKKGDTRKTSSTAGRDEEGEKADSPKKKKMKTEAIKVEEGQAGPLVKTEHVETMVKEEPVEQPQEEEPEHLCYQMKYTSALPFSLSPKK